MRTQRRPECPPRAGPGAPPPTHVGSGPQGAEARTPFLACSRSVRSARALSRTVTSPDPQRLTDLPQRHLPCLPPHLPGGKSGSPASHALIQATPAALLLPSFLQQRTVAPPPPAGHLLGRRSPTRQMRLLMPGAPSAVDRRAPSALLCVKQFPTARGLQSHRTKQQE